MLKNNQLLKYLLYAVGEIVLVVIGILIALYIDGWNKDRENRIYEREILEQIDTNLEKDQMVLERIIENFRKAISSSQKILTTLETGSESDSIKYWLGNVIQFDRFQPLTNSYEQLKSRGLEHIRNKELRFMLGAYYDDQAQHMIKSIGDIEHSFNNEWVPIVLETADEFVFKNYVVFKDYGILHPDKKGGTILKLNKDNYRGGVHRVTIGLETLGKVRELIATEIQD